MTSDIESTLAEVKRLAGNTGEFQIDPALIQELTSINQETDRVKKAERMVTVMKRAIEIANTVREEIDQEVAKSSSAPASPEQKAAIQAELKNDLQEAEEAVNRAKPRLGLESDKKSAGSAKASRNRMRV